MDGVCHGRKKGPSVSWDPQSYLLPVGRKVAAARYDKIVKRSHTPSCFNPTPKAYNCALLRPQYLCGSSIHVLNTCVASVVYAGLKIRKPPKNPIKNQSRARMTPIAILSFLTPANGQCSCTVPFDLSAPGITHPTAHVEDQTRIKTAQLAAEMTTKLHT